MLSRFSQALITLLAITFTAFIWALLRLYSGAAIVPSQVEWAPALLSLLLSVSYFLLLAVAAYLPIRKVIVAKLTVGAGLAFLASWQSFLNVLIIPTRPWVDLAVLALAPVGVAVTTLGLYQLGRAYRATRMTLHSYYQIKESLITIDQLTQLYNRRHFFLAGAPMLSDALDQGDQPVVIAFRVNNLTELNHALGFEAGDEVLARVGKALRRYQQPHQLAARLGGRRFGVLLLNSSRDEAEDLMQRVTSRLQHVVMTGDSGKEILATIELEHQIGVVQPGEALASVLRRTGSSPDREEEKLPGAD